MQPICYFLRESLCVLSQKSQRGLKNINIDTECTLIANYPHNLLLALILSIYSPYLTPNVVETGKKEVLFTASYFY